MKRKIFVLHLWWETLDQEQAEWRGRITKIETGEVRFFHNSATLYRVLLLMLPVGLEEKESSEIQER
jgi:hypothetical protein